MQSIGYRVRVNETLTSARRIREVKNNTDKNMTLAEYKASPKTFIVRFAGTAPNHYDAPAAQLLTAIDKPSARAAADKLAVEKGWSVNSVRQTNTAYVLRHVCPIQSKRPGETGK